uniref:TF-B3 domain-containing protein n=1 Tax=Populus trichocarpa TaxID=3694 RepID=A0A2K1R482_POPTR
MESELMNKQLTKTDIKSCLSYPAGNLEPFQMVLGENAMISFNARDHPTGRVWEFKLCIRKRGRYKKPVIRGDWLDYVREKGLTVNDSIILTKVEDAENGDKYNIRVEPNTELAI